MAQSFTCPNCGAPLDYEGADLTVRCPYCSSSVIVPETLRSQPSSVAPHPPSLPVVGMDSLLSQAAQLKEVARLIRSGNKIEAIRVYRETFNVGLTEAKDAVESLEAGRPVVMPGSSRVVTTSSSFSTAGSYGVPSYGAPPPAAGPDSQIADLLSRGNKIEAIKVYQQTYGSGLKEAKDAVEMFERGFPLPKPSQSLAGAGPMAPGGVATPTGNVPTYTATSSTTSGTYSSRPSQGSFIGSWLAWSFGAFWVAFFIAMGVTFGLTGMVRLAAPLLCPSDYVDAFGERVNNYYADGVSVDGAAVLKCVSPSGEVTVAHPMAVYGLFCLGPMALGIALGFFPALFHRQPAIGCAMVVIDVVVVLGLLLALNYNIPSTESQGLWSLLFGRTESEVLQSTDFTPVEAAPVQPAATIAPLATITPTPAFAPSILTIGGSEGAGPGQFNDSRAIALDGDGNIYVADYQGGRVQVFDAGGRFVTAWQIAQTDSVIKGLAADEAGNVYVAAAGSVHQYDGATGELLNTFPHEAVTYLDNVAVSQTGDIVAADSEVLIVYAPDGAIKTSVAYWGAALSPDGLSRYDVDDISVDGDGNIYITSGNEETIFKFASDGTFIDRIGVPGENPGEFDGLRAAVVDGQGRLYALDYKGVQVFNERGGYLGLIEIESLGFDLAIDDRYGLFVIDRNANTVFGFELPAP